MMNNYKKFIEENDYFEIEQIDNEGYDRVTDYYSCEKCHDGSFKIVWINNNKNMECGFFTDGYVLNNLQNNHWKVKKTIDSKKN